MKPKGKPALQAFSQLPEYQLQHESTHASPLLWTAGDDLCKRELARSLRRGIPLPVVRILRYARLPKVNSRLPARIARA